LKFLIDECLSLELVRVPRERGFGESMHVNHLNLCGEDDGTVLACAVDRGYVLVTNNSRDFLRRVERVEIHAGLVCLDMPNEQKSKSLQLRLFERALDEIGSAEPLNDVLVITLAGDAIGIERFRLPGEP
jgi:predicted nuclease of predicted toxin-antitoxin system